MSKLPLISSKEMEKLVFALGFQKTRQKGSHAFYRHVDGRTTVIPHHPGRTLSRPLIRTIIKQLELEPETFAELLKKI